MADSHIKSNLVAKNGDETISGFTSIQGDRVVCGTLTATAVTCGGAMTAGSSVTSTTFLKSTTYTHATTYIKIGTKKYIFAGSGATSAAIMAEATALVATPIKGSLYLGAGVIWKFNADTTATKMT
uniref:Uncharacterized protein n=1 Tax=viral metagenome TaxID=1070528 RepID=A0A6M3K0K8_9ZZZZ